LGITGSCRPAVPPVAVRARSIAVRGGCAAIVGAPVERVKPVLHRLDTDGSAALLLPDDHPLHEAVDRTPRGELPAMLEVVDMAPVALREPVRGLLWISGWLRPLAAEQARQVALWMAVAHPVADLLDVGHGTTLLWLHPCSVVLADAEGSAALSPDDLAQASPDPLCHLEAGWLRHLDREHPDMVEALAAQVVASTPSHAGRSQRVRPLGVDRLGLRLRVENPDCDHDVRLAFERPVDGPPQLAVELHRLAGCSRHATPR
jgi:hypothetical protein